MTGRQGQIETSENEIFLVETGNGHFCVKTVGFLGQRGDPPKVSLLRQDDMAPVNDPPHVICFSSPGARTRLLSKAFPWLTPTLLAQHTCPPCRPAPALHSKWPATSTVQPLALPARELKPSGEKYTHLTEKQITIDTNTCYRWMRQSSITWHVL